KNLQRGAIVRATLSLGDAFGMSVLAEGVETIEELNFLKAEGCLCVQGYFFSKPMNTDAIRELTMVEDIEMAS
ncbi:MAG: EAL domain-containing protein, partial [Yoonia sp.]|nr:EAL domain-containing protein [Yoonia sp.]